MRSLWQQVVSATALLVLLGAQDGLANNADGSCSKSSPCEQGCCGASGYCGFGPNYCGTGCLSGCDAQAKCGQYAAVPGQECPLNVCCSEFGYVTSPTNGNECFQLRLIVAVSAAPHLTSVARTAKAAAWSLRSQVVQAQTVQQANERSGIGKAGAQRDRVMPGRSPTLTRLNGLI